MSKSLKKGDSIWLGRRSYTVKSNVKNDFGQRVVRVGWGSNLKKNTHTRHTL